jgi:hypothetical protein
MPASRDGSFRPLGKNPVGNGASRDTNERSTKKEEK